MKARIKSNFIDAVHEDYDCGSIEDMVDWIVDKPIGTQLIDRAPQMPWYWYGYPPEKLYIKAVKYASYITVDRLYGLHSVWPRWWVAAPFGYTIEDPDERGAKCTLNELATAIVVEDVID